MPDLIVIPARYGSTRLPGKPLHPIAGRFLVERGLVDDQTFERENQRFYDEYRADTLDIQETAGSWNTTGDPTLVNLVTRGYYQTSATFPGNQALTACAAGYHMANMAEIQNTSALRYAKEVAGAVQGQDSGNGPPFSITGWIRTGIASNTSTQVGAGNCALWTSNSAGHNGTTVALNPNWLVAGHNLSPWDGLTATCSTPKRVWCAQD